MNTNKLNDSEIKQLDWPIEQITSLQVAKLRASDYKKQLKQSRATIDNSYWLKSSVVCGSIMAALVVVASWCFGMAYKQAGWENHWLAGAFTIGILISVLLLITFGIIRLLDNHRDAKTLKIIQANRRNSI